MKEIQHGRQSSGFSLFEAIIISVVLAVLIAVFLPALLPAKRRVKRLGCVNHLKQVGLAFRQWAMDDGDRFPMQISVTNGGTMELVGSGAAYPHFLVLSNELNTPKLLFCPEETNPKKHPASTFDSGVPIRSGQTPFTNDNNVSYFVGVDARIENPLGWLSGDATIVAAGQPIKPGLVSLWSNSPVAWTKPIRAYHGDGGNIVLVDGAAHQVGNASLRKLLQATGVATNRLAMP